MQTIKRAKAANPKLSAVFYLNTLYDFPFLELHGKFLEANADIVDINGKLVAFKNDNGMPISMYLISAKRLDVTCGLVLSRI